MKTIITISIFLLLLLTGCKINNTLSQQQPIGEYQSIFKGKSNKLKLYENGEFHFKRHEYLEGFTSTVGTWRVKSDILILESKKYSQRDSAILVLVQGRKIAFHNVQFKIKNNKLHHFQEQWDFLKNPLVRTKLPDSPRMR